MLTFALFSGRVSFLECITLCRYFAFDKQFCSSSKLSHGRQKSDFTTGWVIFPLLNYPVKVIHTATRWNRASPQRHSAHHPFKPPWHQRSSRSKCLWQLVNSCVIANRKLQWEKYLRLSSGSTLTFPSRSWRFVKRKIIEIGFPERERESLSNSAAVLLPLEAFTFFSWMCCGWRLLRWVCIITESLGGWRWVPLCDKTC